MILNTQSTCTPRLMKNEMSTSFSMNLSKRLAIDRVLIYVIVANSLEIPIKYTCSLEANALFFSPAGYCGRLFRFGLSTLAWVLIVFWRCFFHSYIMFGRCWNGICSKRWMQLFGAWLWCPYTVWLRCQPAVVVWAPCELLFHAETVELLL